MASSHSSLTLRKCIANTTAIKDTTKTAYISDLNKIIRYTSADLYDVIMNPDLYYSKIAEQTRARSTTRTLIKSLLACLKHSGIKSENKDAFDKWYKIFNSLTKEVEDSEDNNVTKKNSMSWSTILKKYEFIKTKSYASLDHVTLAMYTLLPPRRQNDYWKLLVEPDDSKDSTGYLDLSADKPYICVTEYKTASVFKEWKKDLPEELVQILKKYLKDRSSDYLFCKQDGNPYTSLYSFTSANNQIIKRVLGSANVSVNTLRHSAASFVNMNPTMLRKDKKQYAYDMGHSFYMQGLYVEVDSIQK